MSAQAKPVMDKGIIIKWIILAAITCAIMLIPTGEMFTPVIRKFIAITVCAILWICFELTDTFVPAVLMCTMYYFQ